MRLVYARVTTDEQRPDLQLDALKKAGDKRTIIDKACHVIASPVQRARKLMPERTGAGHDDARRRGRVGGRKRQMVQEKVESARKLTRGAMMPRDVAQGLGVSISTLYRRVSASSR